MKYFKNLGWSDIGERTAKTFVEAFLATVATSNILNVSDWHSLKTALISTVIAGLAAGISAVWNIFRNAIKRGGGA